MGKVEIHTNCLAAVPNIQSLLLLLHTKLEPMHCSSAQMSGLQGRGGCSWRNAADADVDVHAALMQQLLLMLMLVLLKQCTDLKPLSGLQRLMLMLMFMLC